MNRDSTTARSTGAVRVRLAGPDARSRTDARPNGSASDALGQMRAPPAAPVSEPAGCRMGSVGMLSELQQNRVWEGWFSAEVRANYFADLAGAYHQRQSWATWAAVFSSSGAVIAFLANLPTRHLLISASLNTLWERVRYPFLTLDDLMAHLEVWRSPGAQRRGTRAASQLPPGGRRLGRRGRQLASAGAGRPAQPDQHPERSRSQGRDCLLHRADGRGPRRRGWTQARTRRRLPSRCCDRRETKAVTSCGDRRLVSCRAQ
jgi:hypothetical protein